MHFGGGAMKGAMCLFGLILNINSVSQKLLTAPLRLHVDYLSSSTIEFVHLLSYICFDFEL